MASSTASSRPGSSSRSGIANGMPAWRILSLARTSRLPMAAGEMRNAEAMVLASSPSTTCRISGARMPASIAGCAQANISARRWSGMSAPPPPRPAPPRAAATARRRPRRCGGGATASIILRRATVSSHASGFAGQPFSGQSASAAANASDSASSACGHVARARGEKGDELAVAAARDRVRRAARLRVAFHAAHALTPCTARSARTGAPRPRRGSRPGSAPPRRSPHRDRARR